MTTPPPARPAAEAAPIPLPVTAVTCLEDRAQVRRTARVRLTAGRAPQRLLLGPVTPLAVDRSLRAEAAGARVLDARIVRAWTPPPAGRPGPDASALRHRVAGLERELAAAELARQRLESRLAVAGQAADDLHRYIAESAGAGHADPERWARQAERVDAETDARAEELRVLGNRLGGLREQLAEAGSALAAAEQPPAELTAHLELVVEAAEDATEAELTVHHLVPCALWRPAYRATARPAPGRAGTAALRLETEAVVWQRTGEDWHGVGLVLSTARSALAASPPELTDEVLTLRDRGAEERRTVEVDVREEEIAALGPEAPPGESGRSVPSRLPGLDDGGEPRVLTAPHPVDVPADGRPHRVPLSVFETDADAEYACVPELSPLVCQVLRFRNEAGHALLAGPVDLVRGSGFTGRAELRFAAPGAPVELSFGSEDTFRVVRDVEERREAPGGLPGLGQRTVLTRTVRLSVSRFTAPGEREEVPLVLRERIPVSELAAVEVRLRDDLGDPRPEAVDGEGVVRYRLALAPNAHREIRLGYELRADRNVAGL